MGRPRREPTDDESALIERLRCERRTLHEIRARLAEETGTPPSIGLLHRWTTEAGPPSIRDFLHGQGAGGQS